MTEQRSLEIAKRLDEIQEACDESASDDPPWQMIQDAFDLAQELLEEVVVPHDVE